MIRRDQFATAVVRLPTPSILFPIHAVFGKFVGPVHPINTGVYMVLVGGSDLENSCNPVLFAAEHGSPGRLLAFQSFMALNGELVGDVYKIFIVVFDTVYFTIQRPLAVKIKSAG